MGGLELIGFRADLDGWVQRTVERLVLKLKELTGQLIARKLPRTNCIISHLSDSNWSSPKVAVNSTWLGR
jgi:hypothetical protein